MEYINRATFGLFFPHARKESLDKFYKPLVETLQEFEINTPFRIAAFFAQIEHESGSLNYVEEIASGHAYDDRKDLGNLDPGAIKIASSNGESVGAFYKGRGLIQLTGYHNYCIAGIELKLDLQHRPRLLCEPVNAARSAGWFWKKKDLNKFADTGNFDQITRRINGGLNGKEQRDKAYNRNKLILGITYDTPTNYSQST